jgi:hypothetical protein
MRIKKQQEKKCELEKSLWRDGAKEFERRNEIQNRINFCKHFWGKKSKSI